MAWKIAEAFLQLKADGMGQVSAAIGGIKTQLGSLGSGALSSGLDATVHRMRGSLSGLTSQVGSLQSILGVAAVGALGKHMVSLAMDTEQTTIAFKVMLGSMEAAKKLMGEITQFAAETPFEIPEVASATRSLIAFGSSASTVIGEVRRLGDIASGVSMPIGELAQIYGKARVQGRLFAEDINQLTGRGIPIIGEIAKQLGISQSEVRKAVEKGNVNFGTIEQAFKALTDEGGRFSGMMKEQSQTMAGIASTAKDDLNAALRETGAIIGHEIVPLLAQAAKDMKAMSELVIKKPEGGSPSAGTDADAMEQAEKAFARAPHASASEAHRMLKELNKLHNQKAGELQERFQTFSNRSTSNPFSSLYSAGAALADQKAIADGKNAVDSIATAMKALRMQINRVGGDSKSALGQEVTQGAKAATAAVSKLSGAINSALGALKMTNRGAIAAMIGPLKEVKRGDFGFDAKTADAAIGRATAKYKERMAEISNMKGNVSAETIAKETAEAKAELQKATDTANAAQVRSFVGLIEQAKKEFEQHKQHMARFYNRGPTAEATAQYQQRIKELEEQQASAQAAAKKTPSFMGAGAMAKQWWANQQEQIRRSNELHEQGNKLWDESRTPMEKYAERLKEIHKLLKAGHISEETFRRQKEKADKELDAGLGKPEMQFRTKAGMLAKAKLDAKQQERDLEAQFDRGEITADQFRAGRKRINDARRERVADINEQHPERQIQTHGLDDFYKNIQGALSGKDRAREEREKKQVAALEKIAKNTAPENNKKSDVARWEE